MAHAEAGLAEDDRRACSSTLTTSLARRVQIDAEAGCEVRARGQAFAGRQRASITVKGLVNNRLSKEALSAMSNGDGETFATPWFALRTG
ncbi:hypothetical protein SAZ10_16375 [Mesorhizobium sp. BAC0120]|uniref:hypothetical protein n=1 Tax=Mesorhizobium sp. BAC0120 TaxID=3090670 RepID=UPI00298C7D43|nr:hypothetical protein [Mesorhizobium sp. BAC0120]MDW6023335.1 hypothetical protein [Mesorhizobium sp. BAC0120]